MIPDARQLVAKLRLAGGLFLDTLHQQAAEQEHGNRRNAGVDDAGKDHVAGNGDAAHRQRAAHEPENADEGDRRQQGIEDAEREVDQQLDGNPGVLSNARFGVVGFGLDDGELVEMPIGEPAPDQRAGQPLPPSQLQAHA